MNLNRRLLYRNIAGALLWGFLFLVLILSVRSVNTVNKTGEIAATAITRQQEKTLNEVREVARAFAVEWATWNGSQENYGRRLAAFLKQGTTLPQPAEAIQEVSSSSVIGVQEIDPDLYRVKVLLHTRRLTPVNTGEVHETLVAITRKDLEDLRSQETIDTENTQGWVDQLICVETVVNRAEDPPTIAGMPVLIAETQEKGSLLKTDCTKIASPEIVTFVNQFLTLYYSGQPLNQFIVAEADIQPLAGEWKLESVSRVQADDEKQPGKLLVEAIVSGPGIGALNQILYIKLHPGEGNGYLIEDIGSGL